MIVDVNGNPIDMDAIREPQTAKVGWLQREFDEHPSRGLTPARLHRIMSSAEQGTLTEQIELADDMEERDAHIYAELSKRRGAITALSWSIEPPKNPTPDEEALTDQVRDWVGMVDAHANGVAGGIDLAISVMTDAILKGFSPQEMVWDVQTDAAGKKVQVPRLTAQPQRWFTSSADRRRFLLRSREMTPATDDLSPVSGVELQPLAWLMHVHPARNGYVARMSLARVLFWPYLFKNYSIRDLAEFLEIHGLPLRLGKYPTGASDPEKLRLLQAVTQIGHNAAGIIPQSMAIEFQAAAEGSEGPFISMWDHMDAAESKAILGQTLTASEGQHGTQALGNVHNDVRMDIRNADARMIEQSFTRQLIQPLVVVNEPGANLKRLPRLAFDTGEAEDMEAYATNLPALAKAGLQIPVKWAQEKLRIPVPEDGEAVMTGAEAAPADGAAPGGNANRPPAPEDKGKKPPLQLVKPKAAGLAALVTALQGTTPPAPDLIDLAVDEQAAQWQPVLGPLIEPLLTELDKAVAAGETPQQFVARLPALMPQLNAEALTQVIAYMAFEARLAGEADLDLVAN